jgi:hypothetical protein
LSSLAALPFEAGHDGGDRAAPFARTSPREKAALLRALVPRVLALAPEMVALACEAAGIAPTSPLAGAAWLSGPVALLASIRSLAGALDDIATGGRPSLPATHLRGRLAGRLVARLEPRTFAERSLHRDAEAIAVFAAGVEPEDVISGQGAFYRQAEPAGGIAWIRDEGGPLSAAPLRVLDALFIEGKVATLAASPARPWLGPLVERAFAPLLEAGFLRVTVDHDGDEPGAPRAGEGGGPVIVLPAYYALDELRFVTRRLASAIAAGAAFDLAAPRILVVGGHWAQRELFLEHVQRALAALPSPWQLAPDLAEGAAPPAGAIGVVTAGGDEPIAMLAAAVDLCNARPAGATAEIVTHVLHDDDPEIAAAIARGVVGLRHGRVGINQWPEVLAFRGDASWGGHPGARMLARVDKAVVRGPLRTRRLPAYFHDNRSAARLGARLARFQAAPSLRALLWGVRG